MAALSSALVDRVGVEVLPTVVNPMSAMRAVIGTSPDKGGLVFISLAR